MPAVTSLYCPSCNNQVSTGTKFCAACGNKLDLPEEGFRAPFHKMAQLQDDDEGAEQDERCPGEDGREGKSDGRRIRDTGGLRQGSAGC